MSERHEPIWLSLAAAALYLGEPVDSFRKKIDRASYRDDEGVVIADLHGIRARKFGKLWKIRLGEGWL